MVKASATGMGQPWLTRPRYYRTMALGVTVLFVTAASSAPNDGEDTGEFALMTGSAFGGGLGTHPTVSGSAGVSLTRFAIVLVDAGTIPVGSTTLLPTGPLAISGSNLFTFGVALQARIPLNRWEPYVLLEPALLLNSYLAGEPTASGPIDYRGNRHSKFGLEGGAGTRYYVKPKWGIRAEFKYVSAPKNFSEINAGVFYQVNGYSGFNFRRTISRLLRHQSDGNQNRPLLENSLY